MLSLLVLDYVRERKESVVAANNEQQDYNLIDFSLYKMSTIH